MSLGSFPADTHANYGFVLLSRHDLSVAEQEFNVELASNPGSLMAKLGLARLHLEQGEVDESAKEIVEVFKADPAFFALNASLFSGGLAPEKRAELDGVLEQRQTDGETPEELLALFRNVPAEQRLSEAPKIATAADKASASNDTRTKQENTRNVAMRLRPDLKRCHRRISDCWQRARTSAAIPSTAFDAAGRLAASSATEARGLVLGNKISRAACNRSSGTSQRTRFQLAQVARPAGRHLSPKKVFSDAEQEYRKALTLKPDDTGALFGLSLTLLADDQIDEALHQAQAALEKNPDDPELNAVMGEILCAQSDFAGAEGYLKKSLNTKPEYIPHVHALLGKVYAQTNRTQEAIAELKLALARGQGWQRSLPDRASLLEGGRSNRPLRMPLKVLERLQREGLSRAAVAMQQGEDDEPQ